jgi:predicted ribosomally synthesized peptide with nif11-like leader
MSRKVFEEFRQRVLKDAALQQRLMEFDDPQRFVAEVVAAAEALGFDIQTADVEAALLERRREWIERWV